MPDVPTVSPSDLQAIGEIAAWLAEQSDQLTPHQAAEMLTEARKVHKALGMAIGLIEAQLMQTITEPILIDHTVWTKKAVYKKRPDQSLIARVVTEKAVLPDDNGELPTTADAAKAAVKMMADLYVSPSTVPKVGGVKALGINFGDVIRDEHTGFELQRTEIT